MSDAERVYLATSLLKHLYPEVTRVSKELLDIFARMKKGTTARDIKQKVENIRPRGGDARLVDLTGSSSTTPETMVTISDESASNTSCV